MKRIVLSVIGVIIVFTVFQGLTTYGKNSNVNMKEESNVEKKASIDNEIEKKTDWKIYLANKDNEIEKDYEIELADINSNYQFDKRAIDELQTMVKDMKKDGVSNVWIQSAYRSYETQEKLYKNKVTYYENLGYSSEEAEDKAQKIVSKPNHSDHNLGLAVDFNFVNYDFIYTRAFTWLTENAEDYGFVLRFPEEKEYITGVIHEPWHWRYVGQEHAKRMNKLNLCLEEYVEYLRRIEE
jgi:D-alanyl-D-alanine carboxypeptidase